ncbi:hypothetical protein [Pandoravirus japonicus]|uniref:Uncharacterized protein n=1 Tax=Pandoravirus japonicus TaxID=2823154 RepID=A0A811BQ83_9VIRU|nr:hypothetical protein [Pandoravirus japonicus]
MRQVRRAAATVYSFVEVEETSRNTSCGVSTNMHQIPFVTPSSCVDRSKYLKCTSISRISRISFASPQSDPRKKKQ